LVSKIAEDVAQEVLRLHDSQADTSEIAQQLNLKKAQVTAIIAYFRTTEAPTNPVPAASREMNGAAQHFSELEDKNDRAERIEEYSADPEPAPNAATTDPEASESLERLVEEKVESDEGIYIGNDSEYGDAQYWNPQDSESVPNPHMMIVGVSGSGKTYASLCLTAELARRGIPTVIFDYAQSYEKDALDEVYTKYVTAQEFRIGEDGISLNPLQIFANDAKGPYSVAARVSDVFDAVYHLGHIQRKVLIEAILSTFDKVGINTSIQSSWKGDLPTFSQLQQTLDDFASDKGYANNKNAMTLSARLMPFFMLSSFGSTEKGWSWEGLFGDADHKVHILQFRGLEPQDGFVLRAAALCNFRNGSRVLFD
jgi:hypothetical protein